MSAVPPTRTLEAIARMRAARRRALPRLSVGPATEVTSVYYLSPHGRQPSGGVRVIYRHVDLLNELGIPAAVLHEPEGFRHTWFANSTPTVSPRTINLRENDILVVPEYYGAGLRGRRPAVRTLVFNQGAYHTFDEISLSDSGRGAPYSGVDQLIGLITVSVDSAALLRYAFPDLPVHRARPVVDPTIFHPRTGPRRRALAYFPSRRPAERHQLMHLLRARGIDWELVPIAGKGEAEVAALLQQCAIFLSFSERDGFGLPPAEAMASGCYVVGYPGGGGKEFFDPDYCTPVSDLLQFAQAIEDATGRELSDLAAAGERASRRVLADYSVDGLREDLRKLYEPLWHG
ncbi:glycosyltransferase [Diaminobutyricimonas sp. LJ205]|uniref:glycosyltransferase n=1 Tax=Diaminobutyricimonas sp. LJ205 TaxID=2683590 RepID=UPI0012F4A0F1|nr:glycosyltransferase [Diaminobutyricimonas sp. LJ205]